MQDRKYLLSIAELLESEISNEMLERYSAKLDGERQKKIRNVTNSKKRAENIGAGLLLQLAVLEAQNQTVESPERIRCLTIEEVLDCLEQSPYTPLPIEYTYGKCGKPYFKNYPYYFNLSHSGEYIFCMLSEKEVGVDIQQIKPLTNNRIAERFFSEEEKRCLEECSSGQEIERLFYRLWTGKEAYGKLTGEGIAHILGISRNKESEKIEEPPIILEEIELADYQLAVCKWKQEFR